MNISDKYTFYDKNDVKAVTSVIKSKNYQALVGLF
jgi:hypothetical protein